MKLRDKVAVITGGGSGIGAGIGQQFYREGANIVLCDIRKDHAEQVLEEIGADEAACLAISADVSHAEQMEAVGVEVEQQFPEHLKTL